MGLFGVCTCGRQTRTDLCCRSQCAHSQEVDVLEFDEYTEELLEVSRQVELDFRSRLGVHRKRPRTWATDSGILAIPTRWLDVSKEDAKYQWRLCGKEIKRWELAVPRTFATMGPLECVTFLCSKVMTWKLGTSGPSARKIMFLDTRRAHCWADATNEMVVESPPEEQVKGEDLVGELLKSLDGARKTAHNWEKKWQHVLTEMNFEIGTWSSAIVCCCEREVCGFFHGVDFMSVQESMQWAWTASQPSEKLILKKNAVLGPDDDGKTVNLGSLGDLGD